MTEDEAKTKWCPFTRVGSQLGGSYNRDTQGVPPVDRCIGSDCMAWNSTEPQRWGDGKGVTEYEAGFCGLTRGER